LPFDYHVIIVYVVCIAIAHNIHGHSLSDTSIMPLQDYVYFRYGRTYLIRSKY